MLIIDKNQAWEDINRRMARTIDKLGKHIDPAIMDVVVALNANDIPTTASCEGHLGWGAPYPWIDIKSPEADDFEQKICWLLYEGQREAEETKQLQRQLECLHFQEERKLVALLEAFYQHWPLAYDRHLIIKRFSKGECRLQSFGAESQAFRDSYEQAVKLKEYQEEMQAFAAFLEDRFFGETLADQKEYTTKEAATILGMKPLSVTRNIERENLAAKKKGRDYFITASELERFKRERRGAGRRPVKALV